MSEPRFIRSMHPYAFRSGKWAEVLTVAPSPDDRDCFIVRFPDGVTDYWVVNDPLGEYEFAADLDGTAA